MSVVGKQIVNPYLPEKEYFPDGEPHVFGDRVYVYSSHDEFNGTKYCPGDYVVWSAPVTDLSDWSNCGVSYPRKSAQNPRGKYCMWAPDCTRSPDGNYYLYFSYNFDNRICVAKSTQPDGPFTFYGFVHHKDGTLYGLGPNDIMCFDPGVLTDDDGTTYLYSGFSPTPSLQQVLRWQKIKNIYGTGGQVCKLEKDMLTIADGPKMLLPGFENSAGTGFEGHEMYEASSMRKVNGKYYFVYSTYQSHELAYAVSDYPDRDFVYGGVIISNGDIGYGGRAKEDALNYWGNNHGSIEKINGQWYIFYHRQTNKTEQSRQGCAERIEIMSDGSIPQVEMTSCGLNGKALKGSGTYRAYIACNLMSKDGAIKCAYGIFSRPKYKKHPCITQDKCGQYIQNLRCGATAGYKYFDLQGLKGISVTTRGSKGKLVIRTELGKEPIAEIKLTRCIKWTQFQTNCTVPDGKSALYFTYEGEGQIDFLNFTLY